RPLEQHECVALASKRYGLPPGYILSLGTREPGKNRLTLLQAMSRLVNTGRDLHLAVVGQQGWRSDEEEAAVEALGLIGRVHFTGYVPQADLSALYNAASVFVFPSLHEGFGLPALEAMACGTPVVTSDRSSLPEVVGEAALLVDPLDTGALAAAITRLFADEGLARELRERGLARARLFSWEKTARAVQAVLAEVVARG